MNARVYATQSIRRMRGGSQSQLMRCSDGDFYVVKFQNNPQGLRILANELLGGLLAKQLGLPTPEVAVIEVSHVLIKYTEDLVIQRVKSRTPCKAGLCVGSRYPQSQDSGTERVLSTVYGWLPPEMLRNVDNLEDFLGFLVFDTWVGNMDSRQVLFVRDESNWTHLPYYSYHALMVDEGFCFNGQKWNFPNCPKHGLYDSALVYENVSGLEVFEKWLTRLECEIDLTTLNEAADNIPKEWNDGVAGSLAKLIRILDRRRHQVRDLLLLTRLALPNSFPAWHYPAMRRKVRRASPLPIESTMLKRRAAINLAL